MNFYEEAYIDKKVKIRDKYICSNYDGTNLNELSKKYNLSNIYILFILCRYRIELTEEHKKMIYKYTDEEYPFPEYGNGYIYKITNSITNEIYVGQTHNSLKLRMYQHIRDYLHNKQSRLYEHMSWVGKNKFKIELIEEVKLNELNEREKYWIKQIGTLNVKEGGDYERQIVED